MKYFVIFLGIAFIAFLVISSINLNKDKKEQQQNHPATKTNQPILYYGKGCPHCSKVEEFIKENKVKEKISFEEKEVWYNQNNVKELDDKAKSCNIDQKEIGVPFLWDNGKCLTGDQDIINYFKEKMKEG